MNARFNVHANGSAAVITLAPGQTLRHYSARAEDEGWSSVWQAWAFDGVRVVHEVETDGSDCDGRSGHSWALSCQLSNLRSHWGVDDWWPTWDLVESSQFDEAAERARY